MCAGRGRGATPARGEVRRAAVCSALLRARSSPPTFSSAPSRVPFRDGGDRVEGPRLQAGARPGFAGAATRRPLRARLADTRGRKGAPRAWGGAGTAARRGARTPGSGRAWPRSESCSAPGRCAGTGLLGAPWSAALPERQRRAPRGCERRRRASGTPPLRAVVLLLWHSSRAIPTFLTRPPSPPPPQLYFFSDGVLGS